MDQVFDKNWFKKHQSKLVWFANTKLGRWVLGFNEERMEAARGKIFEIGPNYIKRATRITEQGELEVKASFLIGPQFAEKLYAFFKPVWWTMHFFDWLLLDRYSWANQLSFGFSTLAQVGDASHTIGYAQVTGTPVGNFATIRAAAGTGNTPADDYVISIRGYISSNNYQTNNRMILRWDTSSIGSGATITAGVNTVVLNGTSKQNGVGSPDLCITAVTPVSADNAISNADYAIANFGVVELATRIAYASYNAAGTNTFTLNASGDSNISKTATTKNGLLHSFDFDTTTPTWASGATSSFAGNGVITGTYFPTLNVTYSTVVPVSSNFLFF